LREGSISTAQAERIQSLVEAGLLKAEVAEERISRVLEKSTKPVS
jgi:hypothetical protein